MAAMVGAGVGVGVGWGWGWREGVTKLFSLLKEERENRYLIFYTQSIKYQGGGGGDQVQSRF